jgi:hypothetical protein
MNHPSLRSDSAVKKASVESLPDVIQTSRKTGLALIVIVTIIVPIVDESAVAGVALALADVVETDLGQGGDHSTSNLIGLHLTRSATSQVGHPRPWRITHVPLVAS